MHPEGVPRERFVSLSSHVGSSAARNRWRASPTSFMSGEPENGSRAPRSTSSTMRASSAAASALGLMASGEKDGVSTAGLAKAEGSVANGHRRKRSKRRRREPDDPCHSPIIDVALAAGTAIAGAPSSARNSSSQGQPRVLKAEPPRTR